MHDSVRGHESALAARIRSRRPSLGADGLTPVLRVHWPLLAAAPLALTTWPLRGITPSWEIDPSWAIGLHLAARDHLHFGPEIAFTYGPLGFLASPLIVTHSTLAASLAYLSLAHFAYCAAILYAVRRLVPAAAAIAIAYAAAALPEVTSDLPTIVVLFACISLLERPVQRRLAVLTVTGGAVAGAVVLVTLNAGLLALALLVATVLAVSSTRGRSLSLLAASATASFVVAWLVTGNRLVDVIEWWHRSASFVAGYTGGAASETPGREWEYFAAALLLVAVGRLVWRHARSFSARSRVGLLAVTVVFVFASFKHGFVAQPGHSLFFFSNLAVLVLAFRWRRPLLPAALATSAAALLVVVATPDSEWSAIFRPLDAAKSAGGQLLTVVDSGRRARLTVSSREAVKAALGVDPRLIRQLRGHTVHVDPYLTSAVWAYNLQWRPLPVFQVPPAYTAYLDNANADTLASAEAPERILRHRLPTRKNFTPEFEAPASFLAMLCNYREVEAVGHWQVLAHTQATRCGAPRPLGRVKGSAGVPVPVPRARATDVVYARFRLMSQSLGDRVLMLLYKKPLPPSAVFDDGSSQLIQATAGNPHVLHVPGVAGFSQGFGGQVDRKTVTLEDVGSSFEVDFYALPLRT